MAKLATLTDSFGGASIGASWSNISYGGGTASESGGYLQLNPKVNTAGNAGEINSATTYDLTASAGFVNVAQVALQNAYTIYQLNGSGGNNQLIWQVQGATIFAQQQVNGTYTTKYSATYNAVTHAWWQIRESGGTTFWDTSVDGNTWTNRAQVADPMTETAMTVDIVAYDGNSDSAPGTAKFANLNVAPANPFGQVTGSFSFSGDLNYNNT